MIIINYFRSSKLRTNRYKAFQNNLFKISRLFIYLFIYFLFYLKILLIGPQLWKILEECFTANETIGKRVKIYLQPLSKIISDLVLAYPDIFWKTESFSRFCSTRRLVFESFLPVDGKTLKRNTVSSLLGHALYDLW